MLQSGFIIFLPLGPLWDLFSHNLIIFLEIMFTSVNINSTSMVIHYSKETLTFFCFYPVWVYFWWSFFYFIQSTLMWFSQERFAENSLSYMWLWFRKFTYVNISNDWISSVPLMGGEGEQIEKQTKCDWHRTWSVCYSWFVLSTVILEHPRYMTLNIVDVQTHLGFSYQHLHYY